MSNDDDDVRQCHDGDFGWAMMMMLRGPCMSNDDEDGDLGRAMIMMMVRQCHDGIVLKTVWWWWPWMSMAFRCSKSCHCGFCCCRRPDVRRTIHLMAIIIMIMALMTMMLISDHHHYDNDEVDIIILYHLNCFVDMLVDFSHSVQKLRL